MMEVTDAQKSGLERKTQFKTMLKHLSCFQLCPLMVGKKLCDLKTGRLPTLGLSQREF